MGRGRFRILIRDADERPEWFAPIREGKLGLPVLVLAFYPNPRCLDYAFPAALAEGSDREWYYVEHQTAGVNCKQRAFWATSIVPTIRAAAGMKCIEARWFGTNLGMYPDPRPISEYQASLKTLLGDPVTCVTSCNLLEEGMYPIDPSSASLRSVTDDELTDIASGRTPRGGDLNVADRNWTLRVLMLGANSD